MEIYPFPERPTTSVLNPLPASSLWWNGQFARWWRTQFALRRGRSGRPAAERKSSLLPSTIKQVSVNGSRHIGKRWRGDESTSRGFGPVELDQEAGLKSRSGLKVHPPSLAFRAGATVHGGVKAWVKSGLSPQRAGL